MTTALNIYTWQGALAEWYLIFWFVGYMIVLTMMAAVVVLWGLAGVTAAINWLYVHAVRRGHPPFGHTGGAPRGA